MVGHVLQVCAVVVEHHPDQHASEFGLREDVFLPQDREGQHHSGVRAEEQQHPGGVGRSITLNSRAESNICSPIKLGLSPKTT